MKTGIGFLVLGYVLSQFYRAFLAVLSPVLQSEIGATPDDLALSSGLWFLAFAAMQIPVGMALDSLGPRRTAAALLGFGGGLGAAVFALASAPWHLHLAMILIGIGCSPVLMAAYYIFGRVYPAAMFATLGGAIIGIGTLGNIAGATPLAWAVGHWGWRETLWGLTAVTLVTAVALWNLVKDPAAVTAAAGAPSGGLMDVLRIPGLWLILPLHLVAYAPAAAMRGLWVGPYLRDVFGADPALIGNVALLMAFAMVVGAFAYGPLDRIFGTRKGVILGGNLIAAAMMLALWAWPTSGVWTAGMLFAALGLFGATFPIMMAHGRSFIPPHLLGRGVTFLNMISIGGAGLFQVATRRVYEAAPHSPAEAPYAAIFLFFAVLLLLGCAIYAFSQDRTD